MSQPEGKIVTCHSREYDSHIPEVTLHEYLFTQMTKNRHRRAFVDIVTKAEVKYSDLLHLVPKLAAALQSTYNLSKGQYVAVALTNSIEFLITVLAVSQCGGIASFVNPVYTTGELEHVSSIIQPSFWVCRPDFLESLQRLGSRTKTLVVDSTNRSSSTWHSTLEAGNPDQFIKPSFDVYQDVVTMPFSSGTTGLPKGVMLTHRNLVTCLVQFKVWCPYNEDDVNLGLLPMFHQYGCLMALTSFAVGATVVNMPRFGFVEMLQAIQEYKVTMVPLVPPIALLLTKHPAVGDYNLSSLKGIISSAAPLSLDIIESITSRHGCDVLQGYGLTETTLTTHFTPSGQSTRKSGSVGQIMPFFEGKVIDQETGDTLPYNRVGEICIRGQMIMKGYKGNLEATREMIDADGWLHTGDIGYYDTEEWLFIVDRVKELIKYKGMQVAPSELEHLLLTHPEVIDAAVVGLPDEMAGELPRAYVVKRQGSDLTEKQVEDYVNSQVANFKKLRGGVIFLSQIPKLASGKILRRQLKAQITSSKL